MLYIGEYFIINKPTKKREKRMRRKLARRCVKQLKKIIHKNIDKFFIEQSTSKYETLLFGRKEGSMSIGWKVALPTLDEEVEQ